MCLKIFTSALPAFQPLVVFFSAKSIIAQRLWARRRAASEKALGILRKRLISSSGMPFSLPIFPNQLASRSMVAWVEEYFNIHFLRIYSRQLWRYRRWDICLSQVRYAVHGYVRYQLNIIFRKQHFFICDGTILIFKSLWFNKL